MKEQVMPELVYKLLRFDYNEQANEYMLCGEVGINEVTHELIYKGSDNKLYPLTSDETKIEMIQKLIGNSHQILFGTGNN